jgi:hypothetical protein
MKTLRIILLWCAGMLLGAMLDSVIGNEAIGLALLVALLAMCFDPADRGCMSRRRLDYGKWQEPR